MFSLGLWNSSEPRVGRSSGTASSTGSCTASFGYGSAALCDTPVPVWMAAWRTHRGTVLSRNNEQAASTLLKAVRLAEGYYRCRTSSSATPPWNCWSRCRSGHGSSSYYLFATLLILSSSRWTHCHHTKGRSAFCTCKSGSSCHAASSSSLCAALSPATTWHPTWAPLAIWMARYTRLPVRTLEMRFPP